MLCLRFTAGYDYGWGPSPPEHKRPDAPGVVHGTRADALEGPDAGEYVAAEGQDLRDAAVDEHARAKPLLDGAAEHGEEPALRVVGHAGVDAHAALDGRLDAGAAPELHAQVAVVRHAGDDAHAAEHRVEEAHDAQPHHDGAHLCLWLTASVYCVRFC